MNCQQPSCDSSATSTGMLVVISGPSGVGKTTITRAIERAIADSIFSVSATTRTKTDADVEGADYHFLSEAEFDQRANDGAFLEHAIYNGNKYGTLREPVEQMLGQGKIVILEIDIQGAIQVKQSIPESLAIFLMPPNEQALLDRLRKRKRESETLIQQRFEIAKREIEEAKTCGAYDAFVVNDDLDHAIGEASAIVERERQNRRSTSC